MSILFISHSSNDNAIADELREYLVKKQHTSLFLDFDPKDGIGLGKKWEEEIYRKIRTCQVFIVLCSQEAMSSRWVFAEIAQAKALKKLIFPLTIYGHNISKEELLEKLEVKNWQARDLSGNKTDRETVYNELENALRSNGIEPFGWEGKDRDPYPGARVFTESDAAVLFGRDDEIRDGLEYLRGTASSEKAPRVIRIVGGPGSGKSSLLRAGLLSRLSISQERLFTVIGPLNGDQSQPWTSWEEAFRHKLQETQSWATKPLPAGSNLTTYVETLSKAYNRPVLLVIDQFEELLKDSSGEIEKDFLKMLAESIDKSKPPLRLLCTLRSDFISTFANRLNISGVADISCNPLTIDKLIQVVEGPATVSDITFDEGLSLRMAHDAEASDFLPLLAFTLNKLCSRAMGKIDHHISEETYRKVNGIRGCIDTLAEEHFRGLSDETKSGLYVAFLKMIRVSEDGAYVRRQANWEEIPEATQGDLKKFEEQHLLSYLDRSRTVQVIHEVVFSAWLRFAKWLNDQEVKEFIVWRSVLERRREQWEAKGRNTGYCLSGDALKEAETWLSKPARPPSNLESDKGSGATSHRQMTETSEAESASFIQPVQLLEKREIEFIEASKKIWQQQQWRDLRDKRVKAALKITIALTAIYAVYNLMLATQQARLVTAGEKATRSALLRDQDPSLLLRSVLLAMIGAGGFHVEKGASSLEAAQTLHSGLVLLPQLKNSFPHNSYVNAAVSSADGSQIATAPPSAVFLWAKSGGTPTLRIPATDVSILAFSPDGTKIAGVSGKHVIVWQSVNGTERQRLNTDENVAALAYRPDGVTIAVATGNSVLLWEPESGHTINRWQEQHDVEAVTFSPDGQFLATAGRNEVWKHQIDNDKRTLLLHLGENTTIWCIAFNHQGTSIATGSDDGIARVWSVNTPQLQQLMVHGKTQTHVNIIKDLETKKELVAKVIGADVRVVGFSKDDQYLATASADRTGRVWEISSGREVARWVHDGMVNGIAFSSDGENIFTVGAEGNGWSWEWKKNAIEYARMHHEESVKTITYRSDGKLLASLTPNSATVLTWEVESSKLDKQLLLPNIPDGIMYDPSRNLLALGRGNQDVWIFNATDHDSVASVPLPKPVELAAASIVGPYIATVDRQEKSTVQVFDFKSKQLRVSLEPTSADLNVSAVAFSPDGNFLATVTKESQVILWRAASGEKVVSLKHPASITGVTFSPDSTLVATTSEDWTVRVWHVKNGKLSTVLGHDGRVQAVAFSNDGQHLVSASGNAAWVWDYRKPAAIVRVLHDDGVNDVTFSPNGEFIATATTDHFVHVWRWRPEYLMEQACIRLNPYLDQGAGVAKEKSCWEQIGEALISLLPVRSIELRENSLRDQARDVCKNFRSEIPK